MRSLKRISPRFEHILHSPQPDGEDRHTHTHIHTALGAALWVLSVHNMAAIILLAAAAEAWGQTGVGGGGREKGEETGIKKRSNGQGKEAKEQSVS